MRASLPLLLASLIAAFPVTALAQAPESWGWGPAGAAIVDTDADASLWLRVGGERTNWFVLTDQGVVSCRGGVSSWEPNAATVAPGVDVPAPGSCFASRDGDLWIATARFAGGAVTGRGTFASPHFYIVDF